MASAFLQPTEALISPATIPQPSGPSQVSLCLIVRNEEATLAGCLASAADLVDDLVVVDTGSTDRTKEVAAGFGARVFDFPWTDDFAAARNEALRHARGRWIFWLDADEHLDELNRRKLRDLFASLNDTPAAFVLHCRCPGGEGDDATVVTHVRLFPNDPEVRWQYRVHEQILPALNRLGVPVRWTDIFIEHTGYRDADETRRKQERNLRLLLREDAERPDDPFTLFNLGWTYLELGQTAQALPFLHRSLALSRPGDSIVPKLHTLIAQACRRSGQWDEARAACRAGRASAPDDAELLYLHAQLQEQQGDLAGAEACLRQLLAPAGPRFASADVGLRSYKGRHALAVIRRRQGRPAEAEADWHAVLAEQPDFGPALVGLGELYLEQGRVQELEQVTDRLNRVRGQDVEAAVLRARGCLVRREFAEAQTVLEAVIARHPEASWPRIILTHVLLQEGRDWTAAEEALRDVVRREPHHGESWKNLVVLLQEQKRSAEALAVCQAGLTHNPDDAELLMLTGLLRNEHDDHLGAEESFQRLLERLPSDDSSRRARLLRSRARHQLGTICRAGKRWFEAEAQWCAALVEYPDDVPPREALADLYLEQERWTELEQVLARMDEFPQARARTAVLRGRLHLARHEFAQARQLLEEAVGLAPRELEPWVFLSYTLLQEGRDKPAAERALRGLLEVDPGNKEARHNLAVLLREQRRTVGE